MYFGEDLNLAATLGQLHHYKDLPIKQSGNYAADLRAVITVLIELMRPGSVQMEFRSIKREDID